MDFLFGTSASPASAGAQERAMIDAAAAVARFAHSTRAFLDTLDGVTEQEWHHRPAGENWSLAEALEHVVLADRGVYARLERVLAAPFPAGSPRFDDAA